MTEPNLIGLYVEPPRSPKEEPIIPPAGYRWTFDVHSAFASDSLGILELVADDVIADEHGMLWREQPVKGKKYQRQRVPYHAPVYAPIYRRRSIRRISRALVRRLVRQLARQDSKALARAAVNRSLGRLDRVEDREYSGRHVIDRHGAHYTTDGRLILPTGNTGRAGVR